MKKFIVLISLIFVASAFTSVSAQALPGAPAGAGTPAGAGDKNLQDTNFKMRSVEIEQAKRDAEKTGTQSYTAINAKVDTKFPEIKEDFEGMQISEAAIIKTYSVDKKIDYALIEISAEAINKHSKRLDTNLFAETVKKKELTADEKSKQATEKAKSMRDLIVDLDNAIGSFLTSKMFGNLKVIDPEVAVKTRNDLMQIQELSEKLSAEAKKLK